MLSFTLPRFPDQSLDKSRKERWYPGLNNTWIAKLDTVVHELTHNTFYAPGQAVFNESFASFVGARGSAWFFRSRGAAAAANQIDARWDDDKVMARFWAQLYVSVDSAFRAHPSDSSARVAARDTVYGRARRRLTAGRRSLRERDGGSRTGEALMQIAQLKNSNPLAAEIASQTVDIILREPIR